MAFKLITADNGVKYLSSDKIKAAHGFATRIGGISREAHTESLNLAFGRGDADDTVLENLHLFGQALDIPPESIISRHQVHSARVVYADKSMCGEGYFKDTTEECDGYVTDVPGIALGVKTADCVPILFCDFDAGVIGAVHAGWRGTASGIAAECVKKMCALGADAKSICAAIGAAIHFCCYEVGEDFRESVTRLAGADLTHEFIKEHNGTLHADVVGMNRHLLLEASICAQNIDISELCTCCHPELFFSHRYSHGKRGTMLSVISL